MHNMNFEPKVYQYRPLKAKGTLFLDRDGVLINTVKRGKAIGSARCIEEVKLSYDITALRDSDIVQNWNLIVVTNQPDISKGLTTVELLEKINEMLVAAIPINTIYVCPHRDEDNCGCRKPNIGMIQQFHRLQFKNNSLSLMGKEYMIGDTDRDMGCAKKAGIPFILRGRYYNKALIKSVDMSIKNLYALRKLI